MSLEAREAGVPTSSAGHSIVETTQDSYAGDDDGVSTRSEPNMEDVHASSRGEIVDKVEDMDILCGRGW